MKYIKTYENTKLEEHLINSIKSNRPYKVKELIEKNGVDKNFKNSYNYTPIMMAVSYHRREIVDYLLSINVDLNIKNNNGMTALMIAANESLSFYEILCDIIDAGADWNIKNNRGEDFLDCIIFDHKRKQIINKYPEKYEMYLAKKEAEEKYNL